MLRFTVEHLPSEATYILWYESKEETQELGTKLEVFGKRGASEDNFASTGARFDSVVFDAKGIQAAILESLVYGLELFKPWGTPIRPPA